MAGDRQEGGLVEKILNAITRATRIEVGVLITLISGLTWLLSHLISAEAKIDEHDAMLNRLENSTEQILKDTHYIKGRIDSMYRGAR